MNEVMFITRRVLQHLIQAQRVLGAQYVLTAQLDMKNGRTPTPLRVLGGWEAHRAGLETPPN